MHEPACDTATLLLNGKVLVTRGIYYDPVSDSYIFARHAELYDPSSGTFAFTGDTVTLHGSPTATPLMNGQVLIAAGDNGSDYGDGTSASAGAYDPRHRAEVPPPPVISRRPGRVTPLLFSPTARS